MKIFDGLYIVAGLIERDQHRLFNVAGLIDADGNIAGSIEKSQISRQRPVALGE